MFVNKPLISPQGCFTWAARRFMLQLALLVPFIHTYLMLFGYNNTLATLKRFLPQKVAPTADPECLETFAQGMRRINRWFRLRSPFPGSCLSRSLALWWLLGRKGIKSSLRIGTRQVDGQFQAHAWVEQGPRPLNAGLRVNMRYASFTRNFTSV